MQALLIPPDKPTRLEFVRDYPDPHAAADEVLIRVHLAGVCATDLELVRGYMSFAGVPHHEFVGTVDAGPRNLIGSGAGRSRSRLVRRVVAEINCVCGQCALCRRGLSNHCPQRTVLGIAGRDGAFAEYLNVPARNCHVVPDSLSDRQAVFAEPLAAAVHHTSPKRKRGALIGSGAGRSRSRLVRLALQLCRPCGTIVRQSTYAEPAGLDLAPLVVNEIHLVGNRCGPLAEALRLLADRRIEVDELVSAEYPLADGVAALAAAERPENVKILLRPGPP